MNDILSVVMPAFNVQDYAEESIKSVLLQTEKNWELIIVDDASTDKSLEIFKKYEIIDNRIKVIKHQKNRGPSATRNTAIKNTNQNSKLVFMLDSDDMLLPEALCEQKKFMDLNPVASVVGCLAEYLDAKGEVFGKSSSSFYTRSDFDKLLKNRKNIGMIHTGACFKKEIFNKLGGYDTSKRFLDDMDLWHRYADNGYIILVQKKVLVQYRIHSKSTVTKNFVKYFLAMEWEKKNRFINKNNLKKESFDEYYNNFNNQNFLLKINLLRDIYAKKYLRDILLYRASKNYIGILKNVILTLLLNPNLAFKSLIRLIDYIKDKIQGK
jgi:glycosyltransferase involved in cell wall biosynthesis